jgi:hypothetical protein
MSKEMSWLPIRGKDGDAALHLRTASHQPWKVYTSYPEYSVPDYPISGGSKGFATFQQLRLRGWNLIPSYRAAKSDRVF